MRQLRRIGSGAAMALGGLLLTALPASAAPKPATKLVSFNSAGTRAGNGSSQSCSISANGRLAVFVSLASDLTAKDGGVGEDVLVRDLKTGKTTLVSMNAAGTGPGSGVSTSGTISANGRLVAFASEAGDLVAKDTNGKTDVFVRDLKTGKTALVSVNASGTDSAKGLSGAVGDSAANGGRQFMPAISGNGRFVAFTSDAADLVTNDGNGKSDVFVRDLKTGATTLVSVNGAGTGGGDGESYSTSISANGQFVAFYSDATDLVSNDANGRRDVFVRDLKAGTTTLVSLNSAGTGSGNDDSGLLGGVTYVPSISADGRLVAFVSAANDLVTNDSGSTVDVFVRDLKAKTTTLVSMNAAGTAGAIAACFAASISANGRVVVFESYGNTFVANVTDNNGNEDVFARDLKTGTTQLVSANLGGSNTGNGGSYFPSVSANGHLVLFTSDAGNLTANVVAALGDAFVRTVK